MFCPTCSKQLSDDLRYCSQCGTRLDIIANYLANPDRQISQEKRTITGITLILITTFILLINFIIYGATSLPHLTSRGFFFWLWVINILTALVIGGSGVTKLVRSGFFRELKERDLRIQIAELEQRYKNLDVGESQMKDEARQAKRVIEPGSITEVTTMRLRNRDQEASK
jgi:hypothetical protein